MIAEIKRIEDEKAAAAAKAAAEGKEVADNPYTGGAFTWPCPSSTRVTSDYGTRVSPTSGASSNHKGIDIGASAGAAIVAAANGTVKAANYSSAAGNFIPFICIVPRLQFRKEQQFPQVRRSPTLEVQVFLLEIIYILVYH